MSTIQNFKGVFGEQVFDADNMALHMEPLIQRTTLYDFEISEHVHTQLVQIFFLEEGSATIFSEGKSIAIEAPCIIYVPQGILHGFSFSETITGEVLTLKSELIANALSGLMNMSLYFQKLRYIPFEHDSTSFKELMVTRQSLRSELRTKKIARDKLITLLIQILIVRLYRLVSENLEFELPQNKRKLAYYNQYIKDIKTHHAETVKVSDYAKYLNISAVHLNRICNELVQKSALHVIHEQLAIIAKRSLLQENLSIAEIAYSLNFKDPSHFSKFFKKQVGKSPNQFKLNYKSVY